MYEIEIKRQQKRSMKLRATSLKRETKLTNLQLDSQRKKKRTQLKSDMKEEMLKLIPKKYKGS